MIPGLFSPGMFLVGIQADLVHRELFFLCRGGLVRGDWAEMPPLTSSHLAADLVLERLQVTRSNPVYNQFVSLV